MDAELGIGKKDDGIKIARDVPAPTEEEVAAQDIQNRNNKNNNGIRNFGPNFDNSSNDNSYNSTSSSSTAAHNRNVSSGDNSFISDMLPCGF